MLFRAGSRSCCVSVNHRNPSAAGALSKVLPKYKRRTESRICQRVDGVARSWREGEGERERMIESFPTTLYPLETRLGSREITSATASRCEFRIYTSRYRELNPRRVLAELFTTRLAHVLVPKSIS